MATKELRRVSDGFTKLDGGCNSGVATSDPLLAQLNQVHFAVNTTFRGGWPMPRPGLVRRYLSFPDADAETNFKTALFQDAGPYNPDDGTLRLVSMHGGRVFRVAVSNMATYEVQDISIPGDLNPSNRQRAWSEQGENYFIIQDGQTLPFIYNGSTARRALPNEIPVGTAMAYGMGRLWVARGREYVGGDIVKGPSGTASLGYRDSFLKFTENKYIAEGGAFGVPLYAGDITGLAFISNINTALGVGELIIHTRNAVFANSVPPDRNAWKDLREPIQRIVQKKFGSMSADSIVDSNGSQFFRRRDGIGELMIAVRNFGQPGNTAISNEMKRIIQVDDRNLLMFSKAATFDNRLLMTASPYRTPVGVAHRGLIALDFDPLTTIGGKRPPEYDGLWTGLKILKIVVGEHEEVERCFIYAVNDSNEIELWELTTDAKHDNNGSADSRIQWYYETRNFDFGNKFDMVKLDSADFFVDTVSGEVDFDVDYRPDSYPCWIDWQAWNECATTDLCIADFGACPTLPNFKLQYRPKKQFTQPADTFDPITKQMLRTGYEMQFRFKTTGYCRHKQFRANSIEVQEAPFGKGL